MAPIVQALEKHPSFEPVVCVTAQHREMLDQVLQVFDIQPKYDLDILTPGQGLTGITTRALAGLEPVMHDVNPDAVMVQGDTTTTFAGALAAFYRRVPVVHLEAGLRTWDRYSPYPEEGNRRLTSQLASLHLAPTSRSRDNLLQEAFPPGDIVVTGNTVIDALLWTVDRNLSYGDDALLSLDKSDRPVLLVTAHRRESWGTGMASIGDAIARIATAWPDLVVVFPIHRNPVVRQAILPLIERLENVIITEPLPYAGFARLLNRSTLVLTDSGGVQEEAPSLGKPVLVMRNVTERPEAVASGTAKLVGTDPDLIVAEVNRLLSDSAAYEAVATAINPYGDGFAAQRSLEALLHAFDGGPRPEEFVG